MEKCHFRETLPHPGSLLSGPKSIKKSLKSDKITSLAPKMDQDGTKSIQHGTKRDPKFENVSKMSAQSLPKCRQIWLKKTNQKTCRFQKCIFTDFVMVFDIVFDPKSNYFYRLLMQARNRWICERHRFPLVKSMISKVRIAKNHQHSTNKY